MLERLEVSLVDVDHDEVLGLAERSGLTAYDAQLSLGGAPDEI